MISYYIITYHIISYHIITKFSMVWGQDTGTYCPSIMINQITYSGARQLNQVEALKK